MVASDVWSFSSDKSDRESESDTGISLANNTSQTEQNLLDEETDDKLIIDTKTEVVDSTSPESLANNITIYTFSIKNSNQQKTADNK